MCAVWCFLMDTVFVLCVRVSEKNNQRNVQARTIIMNDIIPTVHPGPSSSLTLLGVKLYSSSWPVIGE